MHWEKYKKKNSIGIIGYKERTSGECVTSFSNSKIDKATLRQFYDSGLQGDTILVYRTDILKRYSFPQFKGEKFIPEAYLYDLLDQEGKLILIREALYVCEYLEDGYTANMAQLLYNNPQGYFCYINQRLKFDTTIKQKCADTIRYLAMAIAHRKKNIIKNSIYPVLAVSLYGDIAGSVMKCDETDWSITSCNHNKDHHVIHFSEPTVYFLCRIYRMVNRTCCIEKDHSENKNSKCCNMQRCIFTMSSF